MHKAIQLDVDEYLLKPVSTTDIAHVLDLVCAKILLGKQQFERIRVGGYPGLLGQGYRGGKSGVHL